METTSCKVCPMTSGVDYHHEIPRAYGGVDGPQSPLCSGHHSLVHNLALTLYRTRDEPKLKTMIPADVAKTNHIEVMRLVRMIVIARIKYERAKADNKAPRQKGTVTLSGSDMDKVDKMKRIYGMSQPQLVSFALQRLYDSVIVKR